MKFQEIVCIGNRQTDRHDRQTWLIWRSFLRTVLPK